MAGTLKAVRLTRACGYGDVGRVFTPSGTVRDWIVGNGFGVIVEGNEAEAPVRPARLARKALDKLKDAGRDLLGPK